MNYDKYFYKDHLKSDLKKKAVHGAGAVVFGRIAAYAIQLVGTIILARLLTPSDFGLVAMVAVISNIIIEFGTLRLAEATIQEEHINHSKISTLFWINVILCLTLTLLVISLAPMVAWFYDEPRLTSITMVVAVGFVFTGLSIQHLALLQRNMRFGRFALTQIMAVLLRECVAIILALRGWGYWALVARHLVFPMGMAVGAWLFCGWRPGWPARHSCVGPMLKFGINSLGNYTTTYVTRSLDKVLIGWKLGAPLLGFYDRAYHLFVMPVHQLISPLTSVAVATLSRLRNDPDRYRSYYLNAVSMLAFVGMAFSLVLLLVGKDLIRLLLGSQWDKAGEIFSVLGPAIGIMLIYRTHGWLHLSLGRADRYFRWGLVAMVVTIFLFLVGLFFGMMGVAVAYSISFYVLIGPGLSYAGKPIHLGFYEIFSVIWRYFTGAIASGIIYWSTTNLVSLTAGTYANFNVIERISATSVFTILLYMFFVMLLHGSVKPMTQFISLLQEVCPYCLTKKREDVLM